MKAIYKIINFITQYTPKILAWVFGAVVSLVSIYYSTAFCDSIGIEFPVNFLAAFAIVIISNALFQAVFYFLKAKKQLIAFFLGLICLVFLAFSVFGTVAGLWYKIDLAKDKRSTGIEERAANDSEILAIDKSIKIAEENIRRYQEQLSAAKSAAELYEYKNTNESIRIQLDSEIQNIQKLTSDRLIIANRYKSQIIKNDFYEFLSSKTGASLEFIKIAISALFGFIFDMSGCLAVLFSWIIEKKEKPANMETKENYPSTASAASVRSDAKPIVKIEKPKNLSMVEWLQVYADARFNAGDFLHGRTSPQVKAYKIPDAVFNHITATAAGKGIIVIIDKQGTRLAEGVDKQIFIAKMREYLQNPSENEGENLNKEASWI